MNVGRQWVRRLGLLLAAGLVVQVPALVGVGASGASAASTPSYSVDLSIDGSCVATVTARWSGAKVQTIMFTVTDTNYTSAPDNSPQGSVGTMASHGTASYRFTNLNKELISTLTNPFNAAASFNGGQGGAITHYTVAAPCYLGNPH